MALTRYTIWTQEADGTGTMHITSATTETPEQAADLAKGECLEDWGWEDDRVDELRTVGIACVVDGRLEILEWDDLP